MTLFLFIAGLFMLVIGAEFLVRGASRLAVMMKIPSLIIGLTIVAFGTSFPELAVSVQSILVGQADISLGNVVGSNIFNVLFILGISAIITPIAISNQLVRSDVPIMIGTSVVFLFMAFDGRIGHFDGFLLFSGILIYTIRVFFKSRGTDHSIPSSTMKNETEKHVIFKTLFSVIAIWGGLFLLVIGSRWFVSSSITIARFLSISELIIGLTIVAAGTSLPEAATTIIAAIHCERDIAVGNIIGSNIFNLLCVIGMSSLLSPDGISVNKTALHFDIPVMIAVSFVCFPVFFTGSRISRWEGVLFIVSYVFYISYLIKFT